MGYKIQVGQVNVAAGDGEVTIQAGRVGGGSTTRSAPPPPSSQGGQATVTNVRAGNAQVGAQVDELGDVTIASRRR